MKKRTLLLCLLLGCLVLCLTGATEAIPCPECSGFVIDAAYSELEDFPVDCMNDIPGCQDIMTMRVFYEGVRCYSCGYESVESVDAEFVSCHCPAAAERGDTESGRSENTVIRNPEQIAAAAAASGDALAEKLAALQQTLAQ